jgi:hypothetical protein
VDLAVLFPFAAMGRSYKKARCIGARCALTHDMGGGFFQTMKRFQLL